MINLIQKIMESSHNKQNTTYTRQAYHAGSWYESNPTELNETLSEYLAAAKADKDNSQSSSPQPPAAPRAVIAPHAGCSYSGPVAGYAYQALAEALQRHRDNAETQTVTMTIVVLHPSHHVYLDGCAISGASSIATPLGDLLVDASLRMELMNEYKGEFEVMEKNVDEREHSGEMQYPFVQKVLLDAWGDNKNGNGVGTGHGSKNVMSPTLRILPIMVGALSNSRENQYGKLLAPFLARRSVFTVISSDFCHWGKRFGYSPTTPPDHVKAPSSIKEIYQYVSETGRGDICFHVV